MKTGITDLQYMCLFLGTTLFLTLWKSSDSVVTESIFQHIGGVQLSYTYSTFLTRSSVQCAFMCHQDNQNACIAVSYTNVTGTCKLSDRWIDESTIEANEDISWDIYFDRDKFDTVIITTSSAYNYISLEDNGISLLDGQNFSLFEVMACNDVHILLMQNKTDIDANIFEIVIGGWSNGKSVIRYSRQGSEITSANHQPLDCLSSRTFWVSWFDSMVHVGSGPRIGQNEFMSILNANNVHIRFIAISTGFGSTGEWTFYKIKP